MHLILHRSITIATINMGMYVNTLQTTAGAGAGTHSPPPQEERGKTDFKEADFKADLKYPHTTAALIGWRSKDTAQLERYGSLGQARRRRSLREVLNWPKTEY